MPVEASGTLVPDGTEQTLATVTNDRTLILVANLTSAGTSDRIVLRSKRKVLSADGSEALAQERAFSGAQQGLSFLDPIPSPHSAVFTLERTNGSLASVTWSLETL